MSKPSRFEMEVMRIRWRREVARRQRLRRAAIAGAVALIVALGVLTLI